MYSVVLATMLMAGTSDVPQWGCKGCHGCHGWSCHGCKGCYGCSGCYGCCGGCYGCCGGCYGCYGCTGACYGWSCWGCGGYAASAGYGYAGGYAYAGGYGCYGLHSWYGCSGCYGVFGCGGGYGGSVAAAAAPAGYSTASTVGNMPAPAMAAAPVAPQAFVAQQVARPAPAAVQPAAAKVASQITVRLPENARLYVNDDQCTLTSETRSFQTPQLKSDKEYSYTLRAEVVRDGRTVSEVKRVTFKGGEQVDVQFKELGPVRTVSR
ncbi:MAG: TIGR03000 domain-containing protein [Planctomycetia bacterium]|nr:TIGR03000 domain-containing protein [Planctomycetia bacterium]